MDSPRKHLQFHPFSRGRPERQVFQTVSSQAVAPEERYEFWTGNIIQGFDGLPPDSAQRRDFRAVATSLACVSGEMHHVEGDAYSIRLRGATARSPAFDELALIFMLEGRARLVHDGGEEIEVGAGGFFLIDGTRPVSVQFSRHAFIQLDLSRPLLEAIFPGATPPPSAFHAALANSPLSGLLADHLQQFPRLAATMPPGGQRALLDASESFALTTIEAAFAIAKPAEGHRPAGLFAAAQRYIRRHLASGRLTPAAVAAAIGCSRSTLYRLFSANGLTVQGYVRELRLQQLNRLLQGGSVEHIGTLAHRCGLHDTPNISRMFRSRFGISPSEARTIAAERPGAGQKARVSSAR